MDASQSLRRSALLACGIGLAYFALALAAISMTRLSGGIALLWLANAPLIAALCTATRRHRLLIVTAAAIGSMAATLLVSPIPITAPLFAVANVGEALLAAVLLQRWNVHRTQLESVASITSFALAVGLIAPFVSGLLGAGIASRMLPIDFGQALFDWTIGHGIGALIGTPLVMQFMRRDIDWRAFHARRGVFKAIGAVALLLATTVYVFSQTDRPLLFLPLLPLLIGTFSFQRPGAAVGIFIVAIVGAWLTAHGSGPMMLIQGGPAMRLQFLQFYLAVLFLTMFPVAATLVQRDRLLAVLEQSEARYRLHADHSTDIMLTLDPDGTIRFASPAIRELGLFDPDALIGRNSLSLIAKEDRQRVRGVHVAALRAPDRTFTVEYRAVKADGTTGWFETNTRAVLGADGRVETVISVIRDLTWRKAREAELERAAATDPLTGLLNRGAMRACVETRRASGIGATLALLDLDYFKRINDDHGHATGDTALLILADLLRENLRPVDVIGRVGGEEFAILFDDLPIASARIICERLRTMLAALSIPTATGGMTTITTSIGLASVTADQSVEAAFRAADIALYEAKAAGRNRTMISAHDPGQVCR